MRAKHLLLSHLNPTMDREREAVRASVAANYAGDIGFASDGMTVSPH